MDNELLTDHDFLLDEHSEMIGKLFDTQALLLRRIEDLENQIDALERKVGRIKK